MNDAELLERGFRTAFAAWEVYAAGSAGASVRHLRGSTVAVFPSDPERAFLNNAVLERGLAPSRLGPVLDEVEAAYAGIERYAVWMLDSDHAAQRHLAERGYAVDTTTAAMVRESTGPLPAVRHRRGPDTWAAYVAHEGGLLAGADPAAFRVATALLDGELVAAAIGFAHEGDLGIFNVETKERARGRGLATALTVELVNAALEQGCTTATLQSTPMAEGVYERCGFRTVARIVELVPDRAGRS